MRGGPQGTAPLPTAVGLAGSRGSNNVEIGLTHESRDSNRKSLRRQAANQTEMCLQDVRYRRWLSSRLKNDHRIIHLSSETKKPDCLFNPARRWSNLINSLHHRRSCAPGEQFEDKTKMTRILSRATSIRKLLWSNQLRSGPLDCQDREFLGGQKIQA
jgi:hypothetical protein